MTRFALPAQLADLMAVHAARDAAPEPAELPAPATAFLLDLLAASFARAAPDAPARLFSMDAVDEFDFVANAEGDGRPDPDPDPAQPEDSDPDPAPPPVTPDPAPDEPQEDGRPAGALPGPPGAPTPPPPLPDDNGAFGRPPDAEPAPLPPGPVTTYTSPGPAGSTYNVTIEFEGPWTVELQEAFIAAADYLGTLILEDIPDVFVDGVLIDDIVITATLASIDGTGGVLGSAGPRVLRDDGSYLPATGAMTFDIADAENLHDNGNWSAVVLHEMLHALGFGPLWSLMGLLSGSVASGDLRFTGQNAIDTYNSEFPGIAGADSGSLTGVPVETDGGSGTAGGHWDEALFDQELMTGYVDDGSYISVMTIATLEDMGYDTVFDDPYDPDDLFGPIPADPLNTDLIA
ncbi:leishmanolysin-related zinc metalloendopeptidase [Roseovarius sp.]|uniref:leishmanolysin-related zinc metalloendopeptidase n=1 Tax=Roseovarius sp. TaxID=1486281 RepID=UPI003BAC1DC4